MRHSIIAVTVIVIVLAGCQPTEKSVPEAKVEGPTYSQLDCVRDHLALETSIPKLNKLATLFQAGARGREFLEVANAYQGRGGDMWEVSQLSDCSTKAKEAFEEYMMMLSLMMTYKSDSDYQTSNSEDKKAWDANIQKFRREKEGGLEYQMNLLEQKAYGRN